MLAHSLMARGFEEGMKSRARRPTRGVNRTIERMWSIRLGFGLAILTSLRRGVGRQATRGTKSFGSGGATQRRWRAPSNGTSIASTVTCCAWRDPSVAADLFQQTWLNVVRQIGRYDERRSFDTWLFAIGHNAAMDLLRDAPLAVRDNPRYRGKQSYAPCSVWKRIHPTSGMPNSAPEMPEPGM